MFSVSPGSGGCCDCGDLEAWKIPLHCGIHAKVSEHNNGTSDTSKKVPKDVTDAIRNNIAAVLDFILDSFTQGSEEIPLSASTKEFVKDEGSNKISIKSDDLLPEQDDDMDMDHGSTDRLFTSQSHSSSHSSSQASDSSDSGTVEEYVCVVWNGEGHAFSHVLECIMTAKGCNWEEAKEIVDAIHIHVRTILCFFCLSRFLR